MKGYRAQYIMGPLSKALEAVFELCIPLVVKLIIDVGIGNADRAYIVKMAGLIRHSRSFFHARGTVFCRQSRLRLFGAPALPPI